MMNYENWKEFFLGENEVQSTEDQEEIRNFLNGEPGTPRDFNSPKTGLFVD